MKLSNILAHPKTSIAGVLIAIVTITGVLSQQGITLGHAGTGTMVALVAALATAFLGLFAQDPAANASKETIASGSTAAKLGMFALLLLLPAGLLMTGCPKNAQHDASVAVASIGASLNTAAQVNHQMIVAGEESAEEGAQVAGYIDQAAKANDALTKTLQALPTTGTTITAAQAIAEFNVLQQQVAVLNTQGVLHLKSAKAQQAFAVVMTSIQASIVAVESVLATTASASVPGRLPGLPSAPMLGLVLDATEIEELISLAMAAGSALLPKLLSLRGKSDAELQNSALASDAAAEQQAEADMGGK
jgi:hypothetical protein